MNPMYVIRDHRREYVNQTYSWTEAQKIAQTNANATGLFANVYRRDDAELVFLRTIYAESKSGAAALGTGAAHEAAEEEASIKELRYQLKAANAGLAKQAATVAALRIERDQMAMLVRQRDGEKLSLQTDLKALQADTSYENLKTVAEYRDKFRRDADSPGSQAPGFTGPCRQTSWHHR